MCLGRLQTALRDAVERWLERERDQLVLWLPVALGAGIAAWFVLPTEALWLATTLGLSGLGVMALAIGRHGRGARAVAIGALAAALGLGLIWSRAERVAAPVLTRPAVIEVEGRATRVDRLPARELVRVRIVPTKWIGRAPPQQPTVLRINLAEADAPVGLVAGAVVRLRGRLMPPPPPSVPGAYDFARVAWFGQIGATGRGFAPVTIVSGADAREGLRARLSRHIQSRLEGSEGGIASALATGDVGAIGEDDAEAMRRAGLAHLLSVSGLHITAVVGLTMFLALRLLALSTRLALTGRLPLVAAGAAALTAVGYTLLTGSEVPTIRSCVAALLVLAALAIGREAVTLRLVATGALVVLLLWPESVMGASFQLSFAAVTAIVALYEHPVVRGWFAPRGEVWLIRLLRGLGSLLLTGIAVELALMPIAVFHFHKAGIYGALANIVAIPLTTFVIMPLEALALALDFLELGAPAWWLAGQALTLLLWIARVVGAAPGAVAALPAMPGGAFGLMVGGGLWLALWRTRWRRLGLGPIAVGAAWALVTPPPDLLVTGDGRHVALRTPDGAVALLRDRAGDYTRDMLAENGGAEGEPLLLAEQPGARCSRDVCVVAARTATRTWRILATRSAYLVPVRDLIAQCRAADIVISERRLPRGCDPRWLRLDRATLARTGGVSVTLSTGRVATVYQAGDAHPWVVAALNRIAAESPRAYPARAPARDRSAADRRRDSRDRGGSSRLRDGNI